MKLPDILETVTADGISRLQRLRHEQKHEVPRPYRWADELIDIGQVLTGTGKRAKKALENGNEVPDNWQDE